MHIHILGIAGTFMGSLALLAKQLGHTVTGSDKAIYPPMSTQLEAAGILLSEGYDDVPWTTPPDLILIGNAMKRGYPIVEHVLAEQLPYMSGPEWLSAEVLRDRWVLAVAGTHGKTTTTSMLAWILRDCGLEPGYLIGGVPRNIEGSADLGRSRFFVIEADEYDSAFFDKRSKFIHYRPRTLILNNLEFDHADIFPDLDAISRQFHHLVRIVPGNGLIVHPDNDPALEAVLARGCWTPTMRFGGSAPWAAKPLVEDASVFDVLYEGKFVAKVQWSQLGEHNMLNGLAAIVAATHVGVFVEAAAAALGRFKGVKRRLECRGEVSGVTVYDDFAHHPTAIKATLNALRARVGKQRLIAVLQLGSYTMRSGVHGEGLVHALSEADQVYCLKPEGAFDVEGVTEQLPNAEKPANNVLELTTAILDNAQVGDHIVIMSNQGFGGLHEQLLERLASR